MICNSVSGDAVVILSVDVRKAVCVDMEVSVNRSTTVRVRVCELVNIVVICT